MINLICDIIILSSVYKIAFQTRRAVIGVQFMNLKI